MHGLAARMARTDPDSEHQSTGQSIFRRLSVVVAYSLASNRLQRAPISCLASFSASSPTTKTARVDPRLENRMAVVNDRTFDTLDQIGERPIGITWIPLAILRQYCAGLLKTPMLAALVSRNTDERVEFKNGAALEIATNDADLVRGRSAIAVLGTEACFWKTDEAATSSDEEVVGAAEPGMAMIPDGGMLMMASSVHRKRGYMHRRWKELHGNDDSEDICWLSPSATMNPALPPKVVEKALAADPQRARAEFLSIWRDDVSDFIPADILEASTDFGVRERAPLPGVEYFAFTDAAGGTGKDSLSLCIAHREASVVFIDILRERKPRFVPEAVVKEFAEILRIFRIKSITGDRYSSGWNSDAWERAAIKYEPSKLTKSKIYLAALPALLSAQVRLLDSEKLRLQFTGLERRIHPNGREGVDDSGARSATTIWRTPAVGRCCWRWQAKIGADPAPCGGRFSAGRWHLRARPANHHSPCGTSRSQSPASGPAVQLNGNASSAAKAAHRRQTKNPPSPTPRQPTPPPNSLPRS